MLAQKRQWNLSYFLVVFLFTVMPSNVFAKQVDDYQAAWIVSPINSLVQERWIKKDGELFGTTLTSERLFETQEDVLSNDGVLLLNSKMQLILMAYPKLLVCSHEVGVAPSVSSYNRVCLLDENGDNTFDTYFVRSFGRSSAETDGLWFAMNRKMPKVRKQLRSAKYIEIERENLKNPPTVSFRYSDIHDKSQVVSLSFVVDGKAIFRGYCDAFIPRETDINTSSKARCAIPGLDIFIIARKNEDLYFSIEGLRKKLNLRFAATYGLVTGHVITNVILF